MAPAFGSCDADGILFPGRRQKQTRSPEGASMPPEKFESHPQAPHAIARCSACRKRRCAARIRLSRAGRASHRAQQIANRRADRKKTGILAYKAMICRPSGSPSADNTGSDRAGIPSIEAGTLKTGLPVEPSPTGAAPGAASVACMIAVRCKKLRA